MHLLAVVEEKHASKIFASVLQQHFASALLLRTIVAGSLLRTCKNPKQLPVTPSLLRIVLGSLLRICKKTIVSGSLSLLVSWRIAVHLLEVASEFLRCPAGAPLQWFSEFLICPAAGASLQQYSHRIQPQLLTHQNWSLPRGSLAHAIRRHPSFQQLRF